MTDTSNFLSGFFLAGDKNDPRVNPQLRQRLALAMLARDRKYPKNLGEGIAAVGDNFANAIMQRQLEQADIAQQDQAKAIGAGMPGAAPAAIATASPDSVQNAPAVRAIDAATSQPQVIPPPMPQAGLLPATPLPPDQQQSEEPGAPVRIPTAAAVEDWRNSTPRPPTVPALPPQARSVSAQPRPSLPPAAVAPPPLAPDRPAQGFNDRFNAARPGGGQQSGLEPPPGTPVMAAGNEPSADEMSVGRNALAAALMQQQQGRGVPPGPEIPVVGGQRVATTPPQTDVATGIQAAPPPPSGIRAAPPQQVAQAAQKPDFGYVMPTPPEIPPLKAAPIQPEERNAEALKLKFPNNPYLVQQQQAIIDEEKAKRAIADKALNEQYTAAQTQRRELILRQQEQIATKAHREAEGQETQRQADVATRFGGPVPYQQFVADTSKSYDATQQLANSLPNYQQAKQALAQSYTGKGADLKLDASKMLRGLGVPGDYTPAVATEMLQSRMKAIAGGLIKSTVGSQNISDADREFVEKAYSGTISMEPESLRRLLGIAEDTSIRSINRHNDRLNSVANDPEKDAAIRNQYAVPMQYGDSAVNYLKAHPETADLFDKKFGKGHAKAVLTGARYGQ